ncbi:MAG: peptidase [Proteobacteria bacterium]|nr:peptidase [Pseudomonadota bacterium]
MTYCCGILVRDGGERVMAIASAGNLSISQSVVTTLTEGLKNPESGEVDTLGNAPSMFGAAQLIGRVIRHIQVTEGAALAASEVKFDVSFLFGGQIRDGRLRLFMIYAAGNFIECTTDTPYLQIGEHKYGKPVLDRAITHGIDLYEALKIGLVSVDSTMRSNLSVGMPIDVLVARRDARAAELNYRIEPGEPYFLDLRERWSAALRAAHMAIPRPPYANGS